MKCPYCGEAYRANPRDQEPPPLVPTVCPACVRACVMVDGKRIRKPTKAETKALEGNVAVTIQLGLLTWMKDYNPKREWAK